MKASFLFFFLLFFFSAKATAGTETPMTDVLLYSGTGTTTGETAAVRAQIEALGLSYHSANSNRINAMTREEFASYRLIAWPGGNSIVMSRAITPAAATRIHDAVVVDGVSYIGFCAGAFMAQTSTLYNSFRLARSYFGFYSQGLIDAIPISFPSGTNLRVVYWDGPELSGFGEAVARFPDGAPAVAQDFVGFGSGFVILTGVHPEATMYWDIDGYGRKQAQVANKYARTLILAAYEKKPLPEFPAADARLAKKRDSIEFKNLKVRSSGRDHIRPSQKRNIGAKILRDRSRKRH